MVGTSNKAESRQSAQANCPAGRATRQGARGRAFSEWAKILLSSFIGEGSLWPQVYQASIAVGVSPHLTPAGWKPALRRGVLLYRRRLGGPTVACRSRLSEATAVAQTQRLAAETAAVRRHLYFHHFRHFRHFLHLFYMIICLLPFHELA